jgi:hypothetical protein
MKKLVILALSALSLVLFDLPLYAADIKFNGDFRVRGFYTDNTFDASDATDDAQAFSDLRFRLRTSITAGVTTGVVTLDLTNGFGGIVDPATFNTTPGTGGTGDTRLGSVGFGNSHNVVGVREAYLKVDLPILGLAAGRKTFKLGHGLVLDDTVDAIAVKTMLGPLGVMLADAKVCDSQAGPFSTFPGGSVFAPPTTKFGGCPLSNPPFGAGNTGTAGDTDLFIAKANFTHEDAHQLGLFVTYLNDRGPSTLFSFGSGAQNLDLWTVGVTADGKVGPANLNFEADFLTGSAEGTPAGDVDLEGLNLLIGAGMDVGPANVGVTVLYTSGQEVGSSDVNVNDISPNFALGNILTNFEDISDRDGGSAGNLTGIKISAGMNPMPRVGVDAALIWAQLSEDNAAGEKDLGVELDGNARLKLDENSTIFAGVGYLFSGDAFGPNPDDQIKGKVGIAYTF